jgi:hypothetical protein
MSELGAKHDQGKLLFGCFTQGLAPVIKGVVAVLTYGAQKYARDSWQKVPNGRQRYKDALDRHLNAIDMGESHDEESGLPHIFHAVCNLMFVAWFDYNTSGYLNSDPYKFKKPPEKTIPFTENIYVP